MKPKQLMAFIYLWYLMLQRDATSNYTLKISRNGIIWKTVATFSNAGTIANVAILADPQGGGSTSLVYLVDFIRFFASQTEGIGAAP